MIKPFHYSDFVFEILDQRLLPSEEEWISCTSCAMVCDAIKTLAVRGAPAIGIAAAFGLVLAAHDDPEGLDDAGRMLVASRPTAVNLEWAVRRVLASVSGVPREEVCARARQEAFAIWDEEIKGNDSMAELAEPLFAGRKGLSVLTHCNAGSLATGGAGTALGVIRMLHSRGMLDMVYMDETRPLLQGARITAYELDKDGIPCTLITDNMSGWLMKRGMIDAVIVGADRIAANFDGANKIGTYSVAVLAKAHGIPFYMAAPVSTLDSATATGEDIVIEERAPEEVRSFRGVRSAPDVAVCNPAFDVTPHELITAIITEERIIRP